MEVNQPLKKSRRGTIVLWSSIIIVVILFFALPTVLVIFFGMLPSFVAFIIDRNEEKYATFCVSAMNFCGVFPSLITLWDDRHTIPEAIEIITNVFDMVIMFGAAAAGWMIFSIIPPVTSSFLKAVNQRRIIILQSKQKKLITEWGEGVGHKDSTETFDAEITASGPRA